MRTTDDLNPERFRGLGEKVPRPVVRDAPSPSEQKPRGDYGVVTMPDGTLRTTRDNLPKGTP